MKEGILIVQILHCRFFFLFCVRILFHIGAKLKAWGWIKYHLALMINQYSYSILLWFWVLYFYFFYQFIEVDGDLEVVWTTLGEKDGI